MELDSFFSEEMVPRPLWEPRNEWESRVKFVEDNLKDYGLERALNLSLVWANMKFLGCKYPSGTENLVQYYPVPSSQELKQRRKNVKSIPKPAQSFEEVSALLSSAHTQSSLRATHLQIQTIANELCLCRECLKQEEGKTESFTRRGMAILDCYKQLESSFTYDIVQKQDQPAEVWLLKINGDMALERSGGMGKLMEEFVKITHNWQEANQKPPCPVLAKQSQENPASASSDQLNQSYEGNSSHQFFNYSSTAYDTPDRGRGSSYSTPNRSRSGEPYRGSPGHQGSGYGANQYSGGQFSTSPNYQGNRGGSADYQGGGSLLGSPSLAGGQDHRYGGDSRGHYRRGSSGGGYQGRGAGGIWLWWRCLGYVALSVFYDHINFNFTEYLVYDI